MIDDFTREALAIHVDRCIDADGVVAVSDHLALRRGDPAYVCFDNGPEFVAHEAVGGHLQHGPRVSMAAHPPQPHLLGQSDSGVLEGELGDSGVGERGSVERVGVGIGGGALIGLALKTPDLDATVAQIRLCGGPVSDPKPAVQGGRIASVWSEHLKWGLAVMGT